MKSYVNSFPRFRPARAAAATIVVSLTATLPTARAGTAVDFTKNTALTTATNYSSGALPNSTTDVRLITTAAGLNITSASLTMESLSVDAAKAYTISNGTTTATGRTLTLGNAAGFTNASSTVANDLISLTGNSTLTIQGPNGSTGAGVVNVALASSGNLNVAAGSSLTISAVISGATFGLTTTGAGTVTLSGANTLSGGVTVTAGKLLLGGGTGSATGSGAVSIGAAGTLATAAGITGPLGGLVTPTAATSVIAPGATAASNVGTVGMLTLSAGLDLTSGAAIPFDLAGTSAASDLIRLTGGPLTGPATAGAVTFNFNDLGVTPGGTYALINYAGATSGALADVTGFTATGVAGNFALNGAELDFIVAVPEPGVLPTLALAALGALGWSQRARLRGRAMARA